MEKIIAFLLLLVTISCTKSNAQKTEFSKEALAETLLDTSDNQVAFETILSKNKGKNTVIEIWASWCGDCVKAMPKIKELQVAHSNTNYVFISMDKTADKWKAGIEKHQLKGAHYMANDQMGGVFAKAVDVNWIPRYIIIDKTGKIVLYRAVETDFEKINAVLNQLEKQ
ncbi:alkyl hydroperoxide reductase [Flavobacterium commune]|uniref:Alkyl hydroperoxide reductase n=1 Tax=Flavobacterium commune TaxID=1306519 RepID=A0A1D9PEN9_9FLAO|nr:TlpA disulfide reductase family protein [Flavobacterium commune]APA01049.1 alkyl hydroperoxide reductase [Flavobacterium commune]